MVRFRLASLLLAFIVASVVFSGLRILSQQPVATVEVWDGPYVSLSSSSVMRITESALSRSGMQPVSPIPAYADSYEFNHVIYRDNQLPRENAKVQWQCVQGKFEVHLERIDSKITAKIYSVR
jgi:hypothetical protein